MKRVILYFQIRLPDPFFFKDLLFKYRKFKTKRSFNLRETDAKNREWIAQGNIKLWCKFEKFSYIVGMKQDAYWNKYSSVNVGEHFRWMTIKFKITIKKYNYELPNLFRKIFNKYLKKSKYKEFDYSFKQIFASALNIMRERGEENTEHIKVSEFAPVLQGMFRANARGQLIQDLNDQNHFVEDEKEALINFSKILFRIVLEPTNRIIEFYRTRNYQYWLTDISDYFILDFLRDTEFGWKDESMGGKKQLILPVITHQNLIQIGIPLIKGESHFNELKSYFENKKELNTILLSRALNALHHNHFEEAVMIAQANLENEFEKLREIIPPLEKELIYEFLGVKNHTYFCSLPCLQVQKWRKAIKIEGLTLDGLKGHVIAIVSSGRKRSMEIDLPKEIIENNTIQFLKRNVNIKNEQIQLICDHILLRNYLVHRGKKVPHIVYEDKILDLKNEYQVRCFLRETIQAIIVLVEELEAIYNIYLET